MNGFTAFAIALAVCGLVFQGLGAIANASVSRDFRPASVLDGCPPLPALVKVEGHSDYVVCTYEREAE